MHVGQLRHKAHCVQPVTRGLRQTLVMELWEGPAALEEFGPACMAAILVEVMNDVGIPTKAQALPGCSSDLSSGCNHRCHQRAGKCREAPEGRHGARFVRELSVAKVSQHRRGQRDGLEGIQQSQPRRSLYVPVGSPASCRRTKSCRRALGFLSASQ